MRYEFRDPEYPSCLKEDEISKEHEKMAREAGHATAKKVHGDEYDEGKADETITAILKKYKEEHDDEDPDNIIAIVQHAFRAESVEPEGKVILENELGQRYI